MVNLHKSVKTKNGFSKADPKEIAVEVNDASVLQLLVGERDANLKTIENRLEVRIGRSDMGLIVKGQDDGVDLASDLLEQLRDLIVKGEQVFPGDVDRALKMLSGNRKLRIEELFRDQIKIAGRKRSIVPKSFTQKEYMEAIKSDDVVFGVGPAGTGKTYLAVAMAVAELVKNNIIIIVLCRPAVEAGEKLGFLPGDMVEKVNPYLRPLYDALHDMVDYERAHDLIEKGTIEVAPLAFMRGRTLSNAFVILDEAQNTTCAQMKMFLTRLGPGSKCVVTGDVTQIDLPRGVKSGMVEALTVLRTVNGISIVQFAEEDIIRHPLVSRIVAAYERVKVDE